MVFSIFVQIFQNLIQRTESWQLELVESSFLIKVKHKFLIRWFAENDTIDRTVSSDIKHRISKVRHQTSDIKHRTSKIRHRTSNIKDHTSDIRHRTLDILHRTSNMVIKNQTSTIRHRISDIGHGTSNIRHWASDFKHQASDIGHKTSVIRHRRSKKNSKLHKECTCSLTFLPPTNFIDFDGLQGDENCTKLSNKPTLLTFEKIKCIVILISNVLQAFV